MTVLDKSKADVLDNRLVTRDEAIQVGVFTTAQRDQKFNPAAEGMIIVNSTTASFQGFVGGAWEDMTTPV